MRPTHSPQLKTGFRSPLTEFNPGKLPLFVAELFIFTNGSINFKEFIGTYFEK